MQNDKALAMNVQTATDQKYALLFHITPFQLGNLGKFDVWTLSLPLMVTVHGSQGMTVFALLLYHLCLDCDAKGVILWQRAFSPVVSFMTVKLSLKCSILRRAPH